MSNELMPLEERIELAMHSLGEALDAYGEARGDAERLDKRLKQKQAIIFLKYKAGRSIAEAEAMALADPEYELALAEWETANLRYRMADAAADKRKLAFEAWRTMNANKRAEMNLR